jgi:hypothetical protein
MILTTHAPVLVHDLYINCLPNTGLLYSEHIHTIRETLSETRFVDASGTIKLSEVLAGGKTRVGVVPDLVDRAAPRPTHPACGVTGRHSPSRYSSVKLPLMFFSSCCDKVTFPYLSWLGPSSPTTL